MSKDVMILTGAGQIGMAIARRMGMNKKIIIGDKNINNAQTIAATMKNAGFDVEATEMDLSSRESIKNMIAPKRRNLVKLPCLSMPPAFLQVRRPLKLFKKLIYMALPFCSKKWAKL